MNESAMQELRKFVAPELVFGVGSLSLVGRYSLNFGTKKVLVVTDPGVIVAGWSGKAIDALSASLIRNVVFSGVSSNPRAEEVMSTSEFP